MDRLPTENKFEKWGGGILREFLSKHFDELMDIYRRVVGRINHNLGLQGSVTWNPGNILDGDEVAQNVTVTGAVLGDFAVASFSLDVTDLTLTADVVADDTVACVLANSTGGAVNLVSGTLRVKVWKV